MAWISFVEHMKSNSLWSYKLASSVGEQYRVDNQIHSFIHSLIHLSIHFLYMDRKKIERPSIELAFSFFSLGYCINLAVQNDGLEEDLLSL